MNIKMFDSDGKIYLSLKYTASFSFALKSLQDKCAQMLLSRERNMFVSTRTTAKFALTVHFYIHKYREKHLLPIMIS